MTTRLAAGEATAGEADATPAACITFTAYGVPVAQGSLRSLGRGRPTVHSNADMLLPWRAIIAVHARDAMNHRPPLNGAVSVTAVFTLPKPKSAKRNALPITRRLDVDKGARAVLDAITHVAIVDDAQVVNLHATKVYVGDPLDLIGEPGVTVQIREVTP